MEELLSQIQRADAGQMTQIVSAVVRYFTQQDPNYEVMFLSLPKDDPAACQRTLEFIYRHLFQGA